MSDPFTGEFVSNPGRPLADAAGGQQYERSANTVVAQATYFVGRRLGARAEATFLRGLGTLDVEGPSLEDFDRITELVESHSDFLLGGTDASVIALAERIAAEIVVTLDRRHFAAIKPTHCEAFQLLP
jgi:hypothetical protein